MIKKLVIPLLICLSATANSQETEPTPYSTRDFTILPPSPEVAAMSQHINFPVSMATGQPDIDLPIHEIRQGSLSVPISLNYRSGGIRVMEQPGIIGLGWTLLASANISRTVYGMPDEMKALDGSMQGLFSLNENNRFLRNYVKNKPHDYDFFDPFNEYILKISQYCADYEDCRSDMANDVLTIAGLGLSGTFSYDDSRKPVLQTSCDIRFKNVVHTYPTEYVIEDDKGVEYTFGEQEKTVFDYSYSYDKENDAIGTIQRVNYVSAWHITQMKSIQGDIISFEYKQLGRRRIMTSVYHSYDGTVKPNTIIKSHLAGEHRANTYTNYYPKALTRITTKSEIVEFEYDSVIVNTSERMVYDRLSRIIVKSREAGTPVVKTFELIQTNTGSFATIKGPQLQEIKEVASNNESRTLYSFEYESGNFVSNYYYAQDHFGYYNAKNNDSLLPRHSIQGISHKSGDRSVTPGAAKVGMLTKVCYPTGGYTKFVWEQHDYGYVNNVKAEKREVRDEKRLTYRLDAIEGHKSISQTIYKSGYGSIEIDLSHFFIPLKGTTPMVGWGEYQQTHDSDLHVYYPHVAIRNTVTNKVVERIYIDSSVETRNSPFTFPDLPEGNYEISIISLENIPQDLKPYFSDNSVYEYGYITLDNVIYTTKSEPRYWGGMRIECIESAPNDGTGNVVRKRYKYVNDYDNPTESSGTVPFEPEYEFSYYFGGSHETSIGDDVAEVFACTSNGLPTVIGGYSGILYHRVYETTETVDGNIISENNFSSYRDASDNLNMGFSNHAPAAKKIYTSKAHHRGDLLSKEVMNTRMPGHRKKEINTYSIMEGTSGDLLGDFSTLNNQIHTEFQKVDSLRSWKDYTVSIYKLIPYVKHLTNRETIENYEEDLFITSKFKEQYTYFSTTYSDDLKNRLCKSYFYYDSKGKKRETFFTYYNGYNYPETEVTVSGSKIVSSKRNVYDENGHLIKTFIGPVGVANDSNYGIGNSIEASEALKAMINIPEYEYLYDEVGNIVQISKNGLVLASYLWSYGDRYPIVEALNMPYSELLSKAHSVGLSNDAFRAFPDDMSMMHWFGLLRSVCNDYDLTTITYHPLIGIASSTDSSGITTSFSFDKFGRLSSVNDYNGSVIKRYEYNYKR